MKKLLIILFVLMCAIANSQITPIPGFTNINNRYQWIEGAFWKGLRPAYDTTQKWGLAQFGDSLYLGNGTYYRNISRTAGGVWGNIVGTFNNQTDLRDTVRTRIIGVYRKPATDSVFNVLYNQSLTFAYKDSVRPLPGLQTVITTSGVLSTNNIISSGNNSLDFQFNTLAATGLIVSSTSTVTSGNLQRLMEINTSGANESANDTTWALRINNTRTGTGAYNGGLYVRAINGNTNRAGFFDGSVTVRGNPAASPLIIGNTPLQIVNDVSSILAVVSTAGTEAAALRLIAKSPDYWQVVHDGATNQLRVGTAAAGGTWLNATYATGYSCFGCITEAPSTRLVASDNTSAGGEMIYSFRSQTKTTGTAGVGLGNGIQLGIENTADTIATAGTMEAIWTTATAGSATADVLFRARASGSLGNPKLRIKSDGRVMINEAYYLPNADGVAGYVLTTDGNKNLSFAPGGSGGASRFVDLIDAPVGGYAGNANKLVAVNSLATGLTFVANNTTPSTRTFNTTSPLSGGGDFSADRTLSIANAAANGSTKGAAAFTAADFNDDGAGLISFDWVNGQAASGSVKGLLTSADWTTFNNKQSGLSGTGFVKISGTTISYDNSDYQPLDVDLTAVAGLSTTGFMKRTGAGTATAGDLITNADINDVDYSKVTGIPSNLGKVQNYFTTLTSVGNVGTGVDNLIVKTIEAGKLAADSDYLYIEAVVTFASNNNDKTLRLVFGSTELFTTGVIPQNGGTVYITGRIYRTSNTTQKIILNLSSDAYSLWQSKPVFVIGTETLSNALDLKFTGEAISNNDIVNQLMSIQYIKSN